MSVIPLTYRDWWDDWDSPFRQNRLINEHFGSGIRRDDLYSSFMNASPPTRGWGKPWNRLLRRRSSTPSAAVDLDKFQVLLDVQQFTPNEITVKCTEKYIIVEGKHEERADEHGLITRHFIRRYQLPSGINPNDISSALSSDGILTVSAPLRSHLHSNFERVVPIIQNQSGNKTENAPPKAEEFRSDYAD